MLFYSLKSRQIVAMLQSFESIWNERRSTVWYMAIAVAVFMCALSSLLLFRLTIVCVSHTKIEFDGNWIEFSVRLDFIVSKTIEIRSVKYICNLDCILEHIIAASFLTYQCTIDISCSNSMPFLRAKQCDTHFPLHIQQWKGLNPCQIQPNRVNK